MDDDAERPENASSDPTDAKAPRARTAAGTGTAKKPVAKKPAAKTPTTAASTARKPAAKKPATAASATKKPAAKKPTTTTAAVKTVAARSTTKPVAKRTTKTAAATAASARTAQDEATAARKSTVTKTAAAKATAAKAAATRTAAAKTDSSTSTAKATAAKTAAAKTAAAKAAAERAAKAAAAKKAKDEAAKEQAAKAAAAKEQAAKERAAKALAAKELAAERTREKPLVAADDAAPAAETVSSPASDPLRGESADDSAVDLSAVLEADPVVEIEQLLEPLMEQDPEPAPEQDAEPTAEPTPEPVSVQEPTAVSDAVLEAVAVDVADAAIVVRGLVKDFGDQRAVNGIDLTVPGGSFYGIVGPNGAGKTTTLSILAGLLRADSGQVTICGIDQSENALGAKRVMGVLPDRLRTFDRLTGRQLLHYYGLLRGLSAEAIEKRSADLIRAFDLSGAVGRVVSDYSAGMTKKIMLAGALIHSPRVLVLDEPFESVDPVSSAVILDILRAYVAHGGTVILSSHGMELVERVCSRVAIIVGGDVLAEGTVDEVRAGQTLESRFVELSGGVGEVEGLEWLHTFSD